MHIAICDDNVADRKQMERLLQRESDKRALTNGNLYVDSFGNANVLLANPMQYDAFYIDMCKTEGISASDIVTSLINQGSRALIVLCCSDINYRELSFPENVIFLDKPIKAAELSDTITHALTLKRQAPSMIELREGKSTVYVEEQEIMYAVEDGFYVTVTLTDHRTVRIANSAANFLSEINKHLVFVGPTDKTVVNCRYISKFKFGKVVMTDGTSIKICKERLSDAKEVYAWLQNS